MVFQEAFELMIALYLFLAGMGGGAVVVAALLDMYDRERFLPFIKAASLIGMPLVVLGTVLLVLDLGQGLTKPWLLVFLLANPTSAIMWGTLILSLFIFAATVYAAYNFGWLKSAGGNAMLWALIILGICTAGYTAVLLGVLKAIPFWHQTALPILFIISASSTGISAAMMVKEKFFVSENDMRMVETSHFYLIVLEIILLAGMLLIAMSGVPEMQFSVMALVAGPFSFSFWFFLVFLGLLVPAVLFGIQEAKKAHFTGAKLLTLEACVLLGGFFLRYLIIHAGAYTDQFAGIALR